MAIEWDDIRIFQATIRAGDYSSAARRLGLDRTTIGRRFTRLEREAGTSIWERTVDGYRPTARGRAILRAADAMERAMERMLVELDIANPAAGPIRLAGTTGIASLLLGDIAAFRELQPGVPVEVTGARDAIEALHQRQADIGIAFASAKPLDLAGIRIGRISQDLYVARGADPERRIGWGHAVQLANPQPWARLNVVEGTMLACEVDSLPAMLDAVRAGIGAAWLWTFLGDAEPALMRLEEEAPRGAATDLWLLHRDVAGIESAALALRDHLAMALGRWLAGA
ncbi:LysR family transcriptional regulator [Flavisphingomonas formosensis]|uniref:LysR family transcriptional regulator n=1 Tax=Flavisphingomonas formosensis TaxID=861534 RepID=UPI0012F74FDA|nr:LysR family transcriptional regulator [Sphingomonas formosensis]